MTEELLALFEQVKLRHAHKYIVFSLKRVDAKTFEWSIDHRSDPCDDIAQNQVRGAVAVAAVCSASRSHRAGDCGWCCGFGWAQSRTHQG